MHAIAKIMIWSGTTRYCAEMEDGTIYALTDEDVAYYGKKAGDYVLVKYVEFDQFADIVPMERLDNLNPEPRPTHLRLTMDIHYNLNGCPINEVEERLADIPAMIAGEGMLTGASEAEVETWSSNVEVLKFNGTIEEE